MEKNVENRTMSVVLEELNASVDKYNLATDTEEKMKLSLKNKELAQEYNEMSLLNAYAKFMADEHPIVALAKAFDYGVVTVKDVAHKEVIDGVKKTVVTCSVVDSTKNLDVTKFIEWTEECNKCVAADKFWKSAIGDARKSIENEWKKFFASKADEKKISIGAVKRALQKMFDALVFIPCENDTSKNAIIATSDIAKSAIAFANKRTSGRYEGVVEIKGEILSRSTWTGILLDALHTAVEGKTYTITYGTEEEERKAAAKKTANAEAETETDEQAEA